MALEIHQIGGKDQRESMRWDHAPSIPLKKSPSYRRRNTYSSKKPIKFVGLLAAHISEIIAPSAKKIISPMGKMKPSNSLSAIRT
jgi:hypothetical protein